MMALITRSALIQARVTSWVKRESRHVLNEMGLTMSEAMELFLRRLIEDRRLPFDITAFDPRAMEILETAGVEEMGTNASGNEAEWENEK